MSLQKAKAQLIYMLERPSNNVIALSGRWGTGKTYLWNEVKREAHDDKIREALYVSLFGLSSVDHIKRKLIEGAIPSSTFFNGKFDVIKNLWTTGVKAAASHYKALAALTDLNLLLVAPMALRDRFVVIDDIERKHEKLGIDEVLGFIDEYSKQFGVRFVLVLNDDQLSANGAQDRLWKIFREKVIDQEIRLSISAAEAFQVALTIYPSKYAGPLENSVKACGLTNIRIVGKVIRTAHDILRERDLAAAVLARVIPSIVLLSAIHYFGIEDGPNVQFVLDAGSPQESDLNAESHQEPSEQQKREDRWQLLLEELGINACGDFERILVSYLESGLIDDDQVQSIMDRYGTEQDALEARQKAQAFIRKAIWNHRAIDADLVAEATQLQVTELDPYLVTEVHGILGELVGGTAVAQQLLQAWIAAFKAGGKPALDGDNPFNNHIHPDIQAAFDATIAHTHAQSNVVDACQHIAEHSGWGTEQEVAMRKATAADFESSIRTMRVEDLPGFMRNMIKMRIQKSVYDSHFGQATQHFVDACRHIAHDTRPESVRLSKLVNRLFARTSLAAELHTSAAAVGIAKTPAPTPLPSVVANVPVAAPAP